MIDFKDKKITIMGLGLLGRGLGDTLFLAEEGADLIVTDLKTASELKRSLDKLKKFKNIKYTLGKHKVEDFKGRDIILRGPSVARDSKYLAVARKEGTPVEMDDSLFGKYCLGRIIGVTGTRGKTTVATWIYEGLSAEFKEGGKVYLAGNVQGVATLPLIKKVKKGDLVVLELSSWQLQGWDEAKISPHIAVITNIYPDHMNYYKGSMRAYINDKKPIYKYQGKEDYLILNKNSKYSKGFVSEAKSKVSYFDEKKKYNIRILPPELQTYNPENSAAMSEVLVKFKISNVFIHLSKIPHRFEVINVESGTYINDSTATMPVATQRALKNLSYQQLNVILIAGGSDKGLKFKELARDIKKKCKAVVLLKGKGTDKIKKQLSHPAGGQPLAEIIKGEYSSLAQAVKKAKSLAKKGDVILFSPACTSFGMFVNEYDRGEQFKKIVKALK